MFTKIFKGKALRLLIIAMFTLGGAGCGRKAPPVPPHKQDPPAAADLSFKKEMEIKAGPYGSA